MIYSSLIINVNSLKCSINESRLKSKDMKSKGKYLVRQYENIILKTFASVLNLKDIPHRRHRRLNESSVLLSIQKLVRRWLEDRH